jgi:hypothetical protein
VAAVRGRILNDSSSDDDDDDDKADPTTNTPAPPALASARAFVDLTLDSNDDATRDDSDTEGQQADRQRPTAGSHQAVPATATATTTNDTTKGGTHKENDEMSAEQSKLLAEKEEEEENPMEQGVPEAANSAAVAVENNNENQDASLVVEQRVGRPLAEFTVDLTLSSGSDNDSDTEPTDTCLTESSTDVDVASLSQVPQTNTTTTTTTEAVDMSDNGGQQEQDSEIEEGQDDEFGSALAGSDEALAGSDEYDEEESAHADNAERDQSMTDAQGIQESTASLARNEAAVVASPTTRQKRKSGDRKSKRCGICESCVKPDCGSCSNCVVKKRGLSSQGACLWRLCIMHSESRQRAQKAAQLREKEHFKVTSSQDGHDDKSSTASAEDADVFNDEVQTGMTDDGCKHPKTKARLKEGGTFANPMGRIPNAFHWDADHGLWAPKVFKTAALPTSKDEGNAILSTKTVMEETTATSAEAKQCKKHLGRCGQCEGCLRPDCRACVKCRRMKKYGGTGSIGACMLRPCAWHVETTQTKFKIHRRRSGDSPRTCETTSSNTLATGVRAKTKSCGKDANKKCVAETSLPARSADGLQRGARVYGRWPENEVSFEDNADFDFAGSLLTICTLLVRNRCFTGAPSQTNTSLRMEMIGFIRLNSWTATRGDMFLAENCSLKKSTISVVEGPHEVIAADRTQPRYQTMHPTLLLN